MNSGSGVGTVSSFVDARYTNPAGEKGKAVGGKYDHLCTLVTAESKFSIGNNETRGASDPPVKLRDRAAAAVATVFSAFGYAHAASLFAVGAVRKHWPCLGGKTASLSAERHLGNALLGLRGVSAVTAGITFFRSAGDTILHAASDLSLRKRRVKAQALLAEYHPETRRGRIAPGGDQQAVSPEMAEMAGLRNDHYYSDLYRSTRQVVCDRLLEISGILVSMGRFFQSFAPFQSVFPSFQSCL